MIVIQSYKGMVERHQAGEVPFRITQEIALVLLAVCGYTGGDIDEPTAITQQEIDWLLALPEELDFMHYLGGNVHVCETESDLSEVVSMDLEFSKLHGRWPNCTEAVLALDDARYLLNADGTTDYALLFAATNNAGGPSWFIPQHLWQAARVDQQIEAHQQFWNVAK